MANLTNEDLNIPFLAGVVAIEMTVAVVVNSLILLYSMKNPNIFDQLGCMFVMNFVMANTLQMAVSMVLVTASVTAEGVATYNIFGFAGPCLCKVALFMVLYIISTVTLMLTLLSIDRFMFLLYLNRYSQFIRKWLPLITVMVGMLGMFVLLVPMSVPKNKNLVNHTFVTYISKANSFVAIIVAIHYLMGRSDGRGPQAAPQNPQHVDPTTDTTLKTLIRTLGVFVTTFVFTFLQICLIWLLQSIPGLDFVKKSRVQDVMGHVFLLNCVFNLIVFIRYKREMDDAAHRFFRIYIWRDTGKVVNVGA